MFEVAELGHRIEKEVFRAEEPALRQALLEMQGDLLERADFPVIVLISGVEGAGKGETVNLLNAWMDPRHIHTRGFGAPSDEELERPPMWRFWRALPPKGRIGILFGSWYTAPIVDRVNRAISAAEMDQHLAMINRFEEMLVSEGALLLKYWFHLSKDVQKDRLAELAENPKTRWRVTDADWQGLKTYDRFCKWSERALRTTSTGEAPWVIVEGTNAEYRHLTVVKHLLQAVRNRLDEPAGKPKHRETAPLLAPIDHIKVLDRLDLSQALAKKKYEAELEKWQGRLAVLLRDERFRKHSLVAVFEGNDAAGKGGAIRRVTQALDARAYDIVPVAAPTDEERAQPYLWRFWRQLPRKGRLTIFDRSWYGRVLVERVEGFADEADWMRAYAEINDFEAQLVDSGHIVVKFWLAISKDEQLKRFNEREQVEYKRFKITPEDWRNREKWDAYVDAVGDMVERTSTDLSPWTLVEANDKYHARIKVLKTLVKAVEDSL